ncbi:MAG TPA: ABC transporter ATP-binding protein [Promineifilum sp.]|nr:ABC transporter ATP-binding protein [Promineifilum sp.]
MIEFKEVTKNYYSLTALDNITMTLPQGEVIGLLGPNGAGKTTLIKLIAGIISPTKGELRVHEGNGRWSSIGYKPERLVFPGNLMTSQYLEMVAGLCNIDRAEIDNVVLESLAQVNLLAAAGKQIKTLSKGMRQRLGLAQSLIGNPDLILLDEPSSGLDPEGQEEMQVYIEELRAGGKTVVLSSHQLHEVTRVCTYLIILKSGKVHYQNPMAEALTLRPHVAIQVDRPPNPSQELLTMIHRNILIEGNEVILRDEAIAMRRQVLSVLINQGYDIARIEQRRTTLAEIYAEVMQ